MYEILAMRDPDDLSAALKDAYEEGWKLVGPVQVAYGDRANIGEDFLVFVATLERYD